MYALIHYIEEDEIPLNLLVIKNRQIIRCYVNQELGAGESKPNKIEKLTMPKGSKVSFSRAVLRTVKDLGLVEIPPYQLKTFGVKL